MMMTYWRVYLFLKLKGTGRMVETPGSFLGTIPRTVWPLAEFLWLLFLCWFLLLFPLLLFLCWFLLLLKDCRLFPVIWLRFTRSVTLTRSPTLRISSGTWLAGTAKKTVPTETLPSSGSVVVSSAAEAIGLEDPGRAEERRVSIQCADVVPTTIVSRELLLHKVVE